MPPHLKGAIGPKWVKGAWLPRSPGGVFGPFVENSPKQPNQCVQRPPESIPMVSDQC